MARVRKFFPLTTSAKPHPTDVDCGWLVIATAQGPMLQLSTYGSDARVSQPKVSQTLQIDEAGARELLRILRKAFPDVS